MSTYAGGWRGDAAAWNERLQECGGHLLQTWEWGDFKALHGWSPERVFVEQDGSIAMATILFRSRGPISIGYIPRGPAASSSDPRLFRALFREVDRVAARRHTLNLIVEPDRALPYTGTFKDEGFVAGPDHFQPERTVKVPLLEDELLLAQMHQKTRYSVRLADRRGVTFEETDGGPAAVDRFYALLEETSSRNEFGIHSRDYYVDFLRLFGDRARLLFAISEEQTAAGLVVARFGREAIYMYGASSTAFRSHGAAFGLQFRAMQWARSNGCSTYDLWGIPLQDPESTQDEDRIAGTKGDDWRGLYRFKTGFGGQIVSYPPTLDRRYHRLLSVAARRFYGRGGA